MNCIIVGAGQLGSRHLQALLKFDSRRIKIYVIDINADSIRIAKERATEIDHLHEIIFTNNFNNIPKNIFLTIVATSSIEREQIVIKLLNIFSIDFLILEKVLFPNIKAYKNIENILKNSNTKCYVNHARRLFEGYNYIKNNYNLNSNINIQVVGSNWGLACNSLHYIDLFEFLTNQKLNTIDTTNLDNTILSSKRNGYVEFTGSLICKMNNNILITISSYKNDLGNAPSISIMSDHNRIYIQELDYHNLNIFTPSKSYNAIIKDFEIPFQSSITNRVLEDLITFGDTKLTTFSEAAITHKIFIKELLKFYNFLVKNCNNKTLPIT